MMKSIPEQSELDPKRTEEFGPLQNNEEPLSEREFITEKKIEECTELLKMTFLDRVAEKRNLREILE